MCSDWSNGAVILALGSNLGNPAANVIDGAERIRQLLGATGSLSSLWMTEPVDCPPGSPPFINAVMLFPCPIALEPHALLRKLQEIECDFGRARTGTVNEPRPLDLDIIAYGQLRSTTPELTLPHPRAHQRRFVLAPLAELAAGLRLPGFEEDVATLLKKLPEHPAARKL